MASSTVQERLSLLTARLPTLPVRTRRFVTLLSAVVVSLSAGTNYVFSAYSPQLADKLHLSSTALNGIGIAGNLGMYACGPVAGKFVDSGGPRRPLAVAAVFLLVGYGTVWRIYSDPPPFDHSTSAPSGTLGLLGLGMFCTGAGSAGALSGAANGVAKSFGPAHRATAIATVLAGFGLSAFLWAMLSHLLFSEDTAAFLLLLGLGTATCVLFGAWGVKIVPPDAEGLARPDKAQAGYRRVPEVEIETPSPRHRKIHLEDLPSPVDEEPGTKPSPSDDLEEEELDVHGRVLWSTPDMWTLLLIMMCCSGTGLMLINNLGTIIHTLVEHRRLESLVARLVAPSASGPRSVQKLQAAQVSLLSVFNCLGRILAGVVSDFAQNRFGVNRAWYLCVLTGLFVLSQLIGLYDVDEPDQVWRLVVVGGLAYGSLFGTTPVLVLEWFGIPHFSFNFACLNTAPIFSGQAFNLAFGRIYDSHIPPAPPEGEHTHICPLGKACYSDAMRATLAACSFAFAVSIGVAWRRQRMRHPLDAIPASIRRKMELSQSGEGQEAGSRAGSPEAGRRLSGERRGRKVSLRRQTGRSERARSLSLDGEAGMRPLVDWMAPDPDAGPSGGRN